MMAAAATKKPVRGRRAATKKPQAELAPLHSGVQKYERLSISKLAQRFDLDRSTVRKRVTEAGIEPVTVAAKEKLFELTEMLEAVLSRTGMKLEQAKLQRELANARMAEIKANVLEGELVQAAVAADIVQRLFGAMYQELAVRQPKRMAGKLLKVKKTADASALLTADTASVFNRLREDYTTLLEGTGKLK